MPLHDWNTMENWETVHHLWITNLYFAIKERLPAGFRAYMATVPLLGIGGASGKPDVTIHRRPEEVGPSDPRREAANGTGTASGEAPMFEVAVSTRESGATLFVEYRGWLIAAVELVSPGNKDRPSKREASAARYAAYLTGGVHLLLIDVHPRPVNLSFADMIAAELEFTQPPCPAPFTISYRVGDPVGGARLLGVWPKPLTVGAPLPSVLLPLNLDQAVTVDLEQTYTRATDGAYLE